MKSNEIIIAINGSIIKNNFYRQLLEEALQFDFKQIHWVSSSLNPAYGAGLLAASYKDIKVSAKQILEKNKS